MATNLNDDMYEVIENEEGDDIMTPALSKYTTGLKNKEGSSATLKNSATAMTTSPINTVRNRRLNSRDVQNMKPHGAQYHRNKTTKTGRRKGDQNTMIGSVEVGTKEYRTDDHANNSVSHRADDGFSVEVEKQVTNEQLEAEEKEKV